MKPDHAASSKSLSVRVEGKAKGDGALNGALLRCFALRRLRRLKKELGGVMLPRVSKHVLGGVVNNVVLEAAKQKPKRSQRGGQ